MRNRKSYVDPPQAVGAACLLHLFIFENSARCENNCK
jgi:hypothetical protein